MTVKRQIILIFSLAIVITMAGFFFVLYELKGVKTIEPTNKAKKDYVKIFFAGDLMFDRGIRYYASQNGGNDFIFEKLSSFLSTNNINIVNLEGPITNNKSVSSGSKIGSPNNYIFTFDPSIAKTLYKQNIRIVNLGNNHILNFGRQGLSETKSNLDNANVDYFGAPDYPKAIATEVNGVKIAFVGYNEFGGNGIDMETKMTITEIQKAKQYADIVIVYAHWGVEYSKISVDTQKNSAIQFIDNGADLIIGSHPHVIEPMEIYKERRIYYSLGNFIFDQHFDEDVRNGLGVLVKINPYTKKISFEDIKLYLDDNGQTKIIK